MPQRRILLLVAALVLVGAGSVYALRDFVAVPQPATPTVVAAPQSTAILPIVQAATATTAPTARPTLPPPSPSPTAIPNSPTPGTLHIIVASPVAGQSVTPRPTFTRAPSSSTALTAVPSIAATAAVTTTAPVKAAVAAAAAPLTDRIVWTQARGAASDLWTMSGAGADPLRLTFVDARNREPSWSRDGKVIVFTSDREGNNDIYSMRSDGGNPTRLTNDAANDYAAAWSPDGRLIAFVSNRNGNDEIYVMRADGSQQTRLTNNGGFDGQPAWSPDGKLIAFTSSRDRDLNIFVMPAAGGAVSRLTTDKSDDRDPSWSPDGSALAFTSNRSGQFQVYTMKNDGSDQRKLTSVAKGAEHPVWGPTTLGRSGPGAWLLSFVGYSGNGAAAAAAEIWLMRGDGSEQKALTNNDVEDVDPAWFIASPPVALVTQPVLPTLAATPARPASSPTAASASPTKVATATVPPAVAGLEILVDELSPQFSRGGTAKYWKEAKVGFGSHMFFTYNARKADNWGRWTPALPQPGTYEVFVFIPGQNATTQKAAYTIVHAGAQDKQIINQVLYDNTWLSLGTYAFTAQGKEYVQLGDVTGEAANTKRIGFDAMKFVFKSP